MSRVIRWLGTDGARLAQRWASTALTYAVALAFLAGGAVIVVAFGPGAARIVCDKTVSCTVAEALSLPLPLPTKIRIAGRVDVAHVLHEEAVSRHYGYVADDNYYYPLLTPDGSTAVYVYTHDPPARFARHHGDGEEELTGVLEAMPDTILRQSLGLHARIRAGDASQRRDVAAYAQGIDKNDVNQLIELIRKQQAVGDRHWPSVNVSVRLNLDTPGVIRSALIGQAAGLLFFVVGVTVAACKRHSPKAA